MCAVTPLHQSAGNFFPLPATDLAIGPVQVVIVELSG
jgi:hypothetical protein